MRRRMTKYEYRLYANFLSQIPVTVCRQKVIGDYIVDFLIPPLSQPFFFVARKRRLEKREPAGETETALSAPGSAVPLSRQKIIGDYIVDFLIPSAKLIIEVDGSQHYEEKG